MSEIEFHVMAVEDAERLTERIRITAHNYVEAREKLIGLVHEAREGNAHTSLGYPSWTAYLTAVLGEKPLRLARDERQDMVHMLAGEGLSTRAIGAIVGAHKDTVRNDLATGDYSPVDEPRTVESLDGKTRTYIPRTPTTPLRDPSTEVKQEPRRESRPPLGPKLHDAIYDIGAAINKLERLMADDRFPSHKAKIAQTKLSDLHRADEALARLIDALS